ncbi:MAG: NUDIX hydrolase [Deltaproteobacteria bacterium]|nr:NUDIX hydrolase [Deltaproteobacteria bacterium]
MTSGTEYPDRPRVAVGVVVVHEGRVLLVERAKPPSLAQWAVPGGSVELGETLAQAAEREVLEETGVVVRAGRVVHVFDGITRDDAGQVRFHYVIVDLAAEYVSGQVSAADDVSGAGWFARDEIERLRLSDATRMVLRDLVGFL